MTARNCSAPPMASPITTLQAPQSPSAQPSLVPVARMSSRSQSSTVRDGGTPATWRIAPRNQNWMGRSLMACSRDG